MTASGLSLGTAILGTKAYSNCFKSHTQNLAAASAVAGRKDETFISAFETSNIAGVEASTVRCLDQAGVPIKAPTSTYFSIGGPGFIPVSNTTSGGTIAWTRNGTFAPDENLNFVNETGDFLQVYLASNGTLPTVTSTGQLKTLNVNGLTLAPAATSTLTFSGVTLPGNTSSSSKTAISQTVTVLDSLGNEQNLTFSWAPVETTTNSYLNSKSTQAWSLTVTGPSGSTIRSPYGGNTSISPGSLIIEFDSSGNVTTYDTATLTGISISSKGVLSGTTSATPPALTINWGSTSSTGILTSSTATSTIAMSIPSNGITSVGSTFIPGTISHNGNTAGTFKSIAFSPNGVGTVTYSNNVSQVHCGIGLGTFNNINALEEIRAGVFSETTGSGTYSLLDLQEAGNTSYLVPGYYEGSAVDITQTYVQMIQDQQRFMANLKAIETIKEMSENLVDEV
jgi:flagellar hook protein FlgE